MNSSTLSSGSPPYSRSLATWRASLSWDETQTIAGAIRENMTLRLFILLAP